jgi:geranylgeranyl transferase type-2 subunit beta
MKTSQAEAHVHLGFLRRCFEEKTKLFYLSDPIRMNTLYWMLNSLALLGMDREVRRMSPETAQFVSMCQNPDGGFGGNVGMPSSILCTTAALQLLFVMLNAGKEGNEEKERGKKEENARHLRPTDKISVLREEDVESFMERFRDALGIGHCEEAGAVNYAACGVYLDSLVDARGVNGNEFGEKDQRFVCCYVASKKLIGMMNPTLGGVSSISEERMEAVLQYIVDSMNEDGGIGPVPGGESHAAYTFCALSALFLLGKIEMVDKDTCVRFISLRQADSGGLAGRVDKQEDVCYSFWSYSVLAMLGRRKCICQKSLEEFIYSCQSEEGGFSDYPGNEPDLFHTMFALSSLELLRNEMVLNVSPALGVWAER